MKSLLEVTFHF